MVLLLDHKQRAAMKILIWLRKKQVRQMQVSFSMQVSELYRHSLRVWTEEVSDKSATQQIRSKEVSLISRPSVQWQGNKDGLQNKSVFGFEKLF